MTEQKTYFIDKLNEKIKLKSLPLNVQPFYERATNNIINGQFELFDKTPTLTELLKLKDLPYKEKVELRSNHIKQNPHEEFWDYADYIPYRTSTKTNDQIITSMITKISTLGNIIFIDNIGFYRINLSETDNEGYKKVSLRVNEDKTISVPLNRLLASTFIPIPERLNEFSIYELESNHINGIKNINVLSNVEWTSKKENRDHAIKLGLMKTGIDREGTNVYLGEVITQNKYHGMKLIVSGSGQIARMGLNEDSILLALKSGGHHCGCKWTKISKEEALKIGLEIDQELLDRMINDKAYMNLNTKPVLGEIIEGPNIGYKFVLYGGKEITKYGFNQPHVSKCCAGKLKTHMGCEWKYIDQKEADEYIRGVSKEIYETLVQSKYSKTK